MMDVSRQRPIPALTLALMALTLRPARSRDRAQPRQIPWNLAEIYPSDAAWRGAKDALAADLPKLRQFRDKLASSSGTIADAIEMQSAFDKALSRACRLREHARRSGYARCGTRHAPEMNQLAAAFAAESSFIEPELLKAGEAASKALVASEPRLTVYRFYRGRLPPRRTHADRRGREITRGRRPRWRNPSNVYNILSRRRFPLPDRNAEQRRRQARSGGLRRLRALPNRADRAKVMSAFFGALASFSRTFGTSMNGEVQKVLFYSKARKYPSALAAQLDGPNIPASVYTRLVDGVNTNLPAFHRYLKLRKRMMKVNELHYYDLYAPLVSSVDLKYTPGEAQKLVLAAVAPLGTEYQATIGRAFDSRWIDLFPNDGKASGAYSNGGAYDVHPYMLINYNGQYTDVSTLAHELGHTMQSFFSNKTQPYPLAGYPTFVAEVASTFNESLLIDYMLGQIKDDDTRLALLGNYLEGIKGTVFRQTQFAEFELRMHEMARKGEPITGEALSKLYLDITKKYYGHDQGVCLVDDYIAHEWSYIPHFYRDFYVFQYATSFTASSALAEKVKAGDPDAKKRYLAFLSAGGSKYPVDLLKDAGVDMTTDEPLDLTIKHMNRIMDEMETILAKRK